MNWIFSTYPWNPSAAQARINPWRYVIRCWMKWTGQISDRQVKMACYWQLQCCWAAQLWPQASIRSHASQCIRGQAGVQRRSSQNRSGSISFGLNIIPDASSQSVSLIIENKDRFGQVCSALLPFCASNHANPLTGGFLLEISISQRQRPCSLLSLKMAVAIFLHENILDGHWSVINLHLKLWRQFVKQLATNSK